MSLYRRIDSRDDRLDLMADRVAPQSVAPAPTGDWRADPTAAAHAVREVPLRHPWPARPALDAGSFGPGTLAMTESMLRLLDGHGPDTDRTLDVRRTPVPFVQGYASAEARRLEARTRSAARGTDEREPPLLERPGTADRYPSPPAPC